MKTSSLQEVKRELQELSAKELLELCINLAKYKKDNKEYIAYLLFQAHDPESFIKEIKEEIDVRMAEIKTYTNPYPIRKGLRAALRMINKYCKYINDRSSAADLHIYFCRQIKQNRIPMHNARLQNLFRTELKKVRSLISLLHEDLQADHLREFEGIE
jgi:hypothetical protein